VKKGEVALRRPNKETRDQLRRSEILAAARVCVMRYGFHAASMLEIAKQAQMSVGQIYRYFPNKEAIIHAIVESIVSQRLQWIANGERDQWGAAALTRQLLDDKSADFEDRVLLLEVTAEATRNSAVAKIVREADRRLRINAVAKMKADYPEFNEEDVAARVEFLAVLLEGVVFRRVTKQHPANAALAHLYRQVIEQLLLQDKQSIGSPLKRRAASATVRNTAKTNHDRKSRD
jgi:AcrR family transcriptional regulator